MFKRLMLGLTFVAAFSAAGIGLTEKTEARQYWDRPYVRYYAPRTAYYRPFVPYRAYYGPRYVRPYYYDGYRPYSTYYYPDYYYGPRSGVRFSVGF